VAIWDFDAHHGNGTQALVRGQPNLRFASIHQSPGYPGTGTQSVDNCFNYPIAPGTKSEAHLAACREALDTLLAFRPDLLVVSAGFDAFEEDPLTQMTLRTEDFGTLGQWLRDCSTPVCAVLEGGYSRKLPLLVEAFVRGWCGSRV
jgi:acetoin utilization deacetylase AcuC-like enzyme